MTNEKQAILAYLRKALPGGAFDQARAAAAQERLHDPEKAKQFGEQLLKYTLGGAGVGLAGTRLYHLVSELNRQQPKYTKFGPGAKTIDEEEKLAGLADIYNTIVSAPGKLIQNVTDDKGTREAFGNVLLGGGIMGGAYGGSQIMNAIVNKKRKEDLEEQVADAKKEYMRALMSQKHAAALDTAFEKLEATPTEKRANSLLNVVKYPIDAARALFGDRVYKAYIAGVASTGALAGKMTYDWTRARSRDKAIAEAQKARARMAGVAPVYIDPEQMAALKRVASDN